MATFTVIDPSTDHTFMGLANVSRENALLQQMRPHSKDDKDWRELDDKDMFGRYTFPGHPGYLFIVRGDA